MDIKEVMQKAVRALLSSGSYDDLNEEQNAVIVEFETAFAIPKSVTFATPSSVIIILCGFISLCIILFLWAISRADAICIAIFTAHFHDKWPSSSIICFNVFPWINSITI